MEKETKTEVLNHSEGVEVRLTAKGINIRAIILLFVLLLAGTLLFVYIWGEFSAYGVGYEIGGAAKKFTNEKASLAIISIFAIYIFLQAGILYWFGGKDRKALHWQLNLTAAGFYLARPIALKYYRVALLLPGILLGVPPTIHGFCTGNAHIFYLGLLGILSASGDATFWYKLRTFDDEDLLLANKGIFQVTIIKRNYGKKD
ncbi:MAG: hypothetical protein LUE99_01280 [Bacteroides sp.]|nr:hypothetical protein [Bacteroides sp.]